MDNNIFSIDITKLVSLVDDMNAIIDKIHEIETMVEALNRKSQGILPIVVQSDPL